MPHTLRNAAFEERIEMMVENRPSEADQTESLSVKALFSIVRPASLCPHTLKFCNLLTVCRTCSQSGRLSAGPY